MQKLIGNLIICLARSGLPFVTSGFALDFSFTPSGLSSQEACGQLTSPGKLIHAFTALSPPPPYTTSKTQNQEDKQDPRKQYSATKRNETASFVEVRMDLASIIQSKISQKERNRYILTHVWGIQKIGTDEPISRAGIEMQRMGSGPSGWGRRGWDKLGDQH